MKQELVRRGREHLLANPMILKACSPMIVNDAVWPFRVCEIVCKYGLLHLKICHTVFGILTFTEFDTSVICHAVFYLAYAHFYCKIQTDFRALLRK